MSLDLQLNMAEQQTARLKREDKDLIDRWMARMGQEADAMNEASKFERIMVLMRFAMTVRIYVNTAQNATCQLNKSLGHQTSQTSHRFH